MIFRASSAAQRPIAPALLPDAQSLEEREPGQQVLAAREFRYPVRQQRVSMRADQHRKMNLLEKFILRASVEISPAPSLEELADALGLDPLFIRSVFDDLFSLQSVTYTGNRLDVTEEGRKSLSSETVSLEPRYDTWYLIQDIVLGTTTFSRQPLDAIDEELEDLSSYVMKDLTQFPAFEFNPDKLRDQLQELELDLYKSDLVRIVTEIAPTAPPELRWKPIAIFVLYDTLCESPDSAISFRAYSEGDAVPQVAEWLEAQLQQRHLSLKTLCGLTDNFMTQEEALQDEDSLEKRLVEERLENIQQRAMNELRLKRAESQRQEQGGDQAGEQTVKKREDQAAEKEPGTAVQLRDVEIHPAFMKALQEAREQIIIYSPWINEQVVDNNFLSLLEDLVQRGVRILIGYGIGRDEQREERPIPPVLRQRLRAVQSPERTPGIIAEWLGNSHAKEIIIDRSIHFSGSHNWLSYRGDRFPRGETVYRVTIATEVEKAYNHLSRRFMERAKTLWEKATDGENRRLALCILCYLGREQGAMEWIERDMDYHLIPLWLTLAQRAISSGDEARILASLQTVVGLCSTAVKPQDPLFMEIGMALRDVLKVMTMKNQELASNFVRDHLPELKQLGFDQQ